MPDGYVYLVEWTERQTMDAGVVQLNAKAREYSNTTEAVVRDEIATLQASGIAQDFTLQRRLPTPAYEALTV